MERKTFKAIVFGGTGTIGAFSRSSGRVPSDPKIQEVVWKDFDAHLKGPENDPLTEDVELFRGYDVCFNSVGISSSKVSRKDYEKIVYTYGTSICKILCRADVPYFYHTSLLEASNSWLVKILNYAYVHSNTENKMKEFVNDSKASLGLAFIRPLLVAEENTYGYKIFKWFGEKVAITPVDLARALWYHFELSWSENKPFVRDIWPVQYTQLLEEVKKMEKSIGEERK